MTASIYEPFLAKIETYCQAIVMDVQLPAANKLHAIMIYNAAYSGIAATATLAGTQAGLSFRNSSAQLSDGGPYESPLFSHRWTASWGWGNGITCSLRPNRKDPTRMLLIGRLSTFWAHVAGAVGGCALYALWLFPASTPVGFSFFILLPFLFLLPLGLGFGWLFLNRWKLWPRVAGGLGVFVGALVAFFGPLALGYAAGWIAVTSYINARGDPARRRFLAGLMEGARIRILDEAARIPVPQLMPYYPWPTYAPSVGSRIMAPR